MYVLWYIYICCLLFVLADAPSLPPPRCVLTGLIKQDQIILQGVSSEPKSNPNILWRRCNENFTSCEHILGTYSNNYTKTKGRYEQYKDVGTETYNLIINNITINDVTWYTFGYGDCEAVVNLLATTPTPTSTTPPITTETAKGVITDQGTQLEVWQVVLIVIITISTVVAVVVFVLDKLCNNSKLFDWFWDKLRRNRRYASGDKAGRLTRSDNCSEKQDDDQQDENGLSANQYQNAVLTQNIKDIINPKEPEAQDIQQNPVQEQSMLNQLQPEDDSSSAVLLTGNVMPLNMLENRNI